LDYELIANLAAQFPEATVLMIGPTAKVDLASLPQAPNVKWMGQRPYSDLPAYVKAFDVCLMPFALNEATEYINPTKTLEYMAAGKPIVSTPVADVQRNFGSVVAVAHSAEEFVGRVRDVLKDPQVQRIQAGLAVAEAQSWEGVVGRMSALTATALARRNIPLTTAAAALNSPERPPRLRMDAVRYADPVAEAS
jgi:glycosyltransferase involved in cell wall biosynthesis